MTRVLRLLAAAIAIAGAIDPEITVSGASRARIAILTQQPATSPIEAARARLARDLDSGYELVPRLTSDAAMAIVIGDRYPAESLPDAMPAATVTIPPAPGAGARISRIAAPRQVPLATVIHLDVDLQGSGLAGQTTEAVAAIAGLEIGRASHTWAEGETLWRAGLDVVPIGEPPYVIQVRLKPDTTVTANGTPVPSGSSRTAGTANGIPVVSGFSRTVSDVVVDARREPFVVQFFEPRPSWATTFIRRALESDARFEVSALSFTSRGVSVQTGQPSPLADSRIDGAEVVIVGGLDRLTAADGRALQRYMRERGGAVAVVPDQRVEAGAARDLIAAGDAVERLLEQPAKLLLAQPAAPFQASELLVFPNVPSSAEVIGRVPGTGGPPVIVSMPRGQGRLLLSGALDAWRYRAADDGAFDRFWRSTIAGLALAAPPPIEVSVDPPLTRPGEAVSVSVRVRARDVSAVSGSVDGDPIRLLPDAETGVYRARFTSRPTPGRSRVDVTIASSSGTQTASQTFVVEDAVQRVSPAGPSLAMLASSHGGLDVTPDRLADLERFVRTTVTPPRTLQLCHPMRSVWWALAFALCLSAEWWLRRRKGLR